MASSVMGQDMGVQCCVIGFTEKDVVDVAELVRFTASVFAASHTIEVMRTKGEDQSWRRLRSLSTNLKVLAQAGGAVVFQASGEMEHLGFKKTIEEAVRDIERGSSIRISLRPQAWQIMDAEIRAAIPESIHGGCIPNSPVVRVGWHDLFEVQENPSGQLFGRASYSLSLVGKGSPHDWAEFRRRIVEVPAVREAFSKLEVVTGPLRRCVYWE